MDGNEMKYKIIHKRKNQITYQEKRKDAYVAYSLPMDLIKKIKGEKV